MSDIKAELLESFNDDLGVVNAARVSMGKSRTEFDSSDKAGSDSRLTNYLINSEPVPHFAPLTHGRETFIINPPLQLGKLSETDSTGLIHYDNGRKIRHSVYGLANLINKGYLYPDSADIVNREMINKYPNVWPKLVDMPLPEQYNESAAHLFSDEELDPRFIDATFRYTDPIQVARQEFKHQVAKTRSELSRRYVSNKPEFLTVDEWRSKPEKSVKQGSGGKHPNQWLPSALYWVMCKLSGGIYNYLVKLGYAPEQLRGFLTQNMMTQYIVTGNLSAFRRMMTQRLDNHAQVEIRELAKQVDAQLTEKYGDIWLNTKYIK